MQARPIGIVGVGNMGGAMALRLLDRGRAAPVAARCGGLDDASLRQHLRTSR